MWGDSSRLVQFCQLRWSDINSPSILPGIRFWHFMPNLRQYSLDYWGESFIRSENTMLTDSSVQRCCQSLFLVEVVSLVQTGTKIRKHFQKLSFQSFWWGAGVLKICQSRFSQKKDTFLATSCFLHLNLGPVPFHTNPNTALPLKEKLNCVWHWIQVAVGAFSSATK